MALLVVLVCLATYRATRLVVADEFPFAPLRAAVERRFGDDSRPALLVNCPWCMSVWIGAAITAATDQLARGGLQAPLLVWATASAVTGLIASVEPI